MAGRIARFHDIRQRSTALAFIDCVLPGHYRRNFAVVGDTAVENPALAPVISAPHRFQLGMFEAPPGCGPAWHTHEYVELFVPLVGRWRFYYGTEPDGHENPLGEVELEPWDVISFPAGLWRGFENAGPSNAIALAVLDPHDQFAFRDPIWPDWLVRSAAERGFEVDDRGRMIAPAHAERIEAEVGARIDGAAVTP